MRPSSVSLLINDALAMLNWDISELPNGEYYLWAVAENTTENVVLTPHIGSATRSSRLGMAMLAARNLLAWVGGTELLTPVALPSRN